MNPCLAGNRLTNASLPLLILWLILQMRKSLRIWGEGGVRCGLHKCLEVWMHFPATWPFWAGCNPYVIPQKPAECDTKVNFGSLICKTGLKIPWEQAFLWGYWHFVLILAITTTSPVAVIASWHEQSQGRQKPEIKNHHNLPFLSPRSWLGHVVIPEHKEEKAEVVPNDNFLDFAK